MVFNGENKFGKVIAPVVSAAILSGSAAIMEIKKDASVFSTEDLNLISNFKYEETLLKRIAIPVVILSPEDVKKTLDRISKIDFSLQALTHETNDYSTSLMYLKKFQYSIVALRASLERFEFNHNAASKEVRQNVVKLKKILNYHFALVSKILRSIDSRSIYFFSRIRTPDFPDVSNLEQNDARTAYYERGMSQRYVDMITRSGAFEDSRMAVEYFEAGIDFESVETMIRIGPGRVNFFLDKVPKNSLSKISIKALIEDISRSLDGTSDGVNRQLLTEVHATGLNFNIALPEDLNLLGIIKPGDVHSPNIKVRESFVLAVLLEAKLVSLRELEEAKKEGLDARSIIFLLAKRKNLKDYLDWAKHYKTGNPNILVTIMRNGFSETDFEKALKRISRKESPDQRDLEDVLIILKYLNYKDYEVFLQSYDNLQELAQAYDINLSDQGSLVGEFLRRNPGKAISKDYLKNYSDFISKIPDYSTLNNEQNKRLKRRILLDAIHFSVEPELLEIFMGELSTLKADVITLSTLGKLTLPKDMVRSIMNLKMQRGQISDFQKMSWIFIPHLQ